MDLNGVLQTVLRRRGQENFSIKPKQKEALQNIVLNNRDCLIALPTGYGKSLIYQLLPPLFDCLGQKDSPKDEKSIVIVVSPLNALIDDQINKLKLAGVSCASLRVLCGKEADERFEELEAGKFQLIFTHPEVAVSNRKCREIFLSTYYQRNVVAVVIDEVHCIIEW